MTSTQGTNVAWRLGPYADAVDRETGRVVEVVVRQRGAGREHSKNSKGEHLDKSVNEHYTNVEITHIQLTER